LAILFLAASAAKEHSVGVRRIRKRSRALLASMQRNWNDKDPYSIIDVLLLFSIDASHDIPFP